MGTSARKGIALAIWAATMIASFAPTTVVADPPQTGDHYALECRFETGEFKHRRECRARAQVCISEAGSYQPDQAPPHSMGHCSSALAVECEGEAIYSYGAAIARLPGGLILQGITSREFPYPPSIFTTSPGSIPSSDHPWEVDAVLNFDQLQLPGKCEFSFRPGVRATGWAESSG